MIGSETESFHLLSQNDIHYLRSRKFRIIHSAAVQIAIKPLHRLGLNVLIYVILRDARHLEFGDSLLAIMRSNMLIGPIYFDCFPNLELDCQNDDNIMMALTVNIQTKGYSMMEGSTNLYLRYRVYYKAMTLEDLSPKALKHTLVRDRTMMYQVNFDKSTIKIPKQITWNEVIADTQWNFDNISQPQPVKQDNPTFYIEDG